LLLGARDFSSNIASWERAHGAARSAAQHTRALFWFHFASPNVSKIEGVSCRRSTDGGIYITSSPPTGEANE
jgi:hypothetical protein